MADLKTAASAVPGKLVELALLPSTETAQFTSGAGVATDVTSTNLANTTGSAVTVYLSVVKSGGTPGAANRVIPGISIPAYSALDAGKFFLNEGDFISGYASAASAVSLVLTGVAFSNSTGAVASGIQDDAVGSGGRTSSSATVTGTNVIGTGANRYLLGALWVSSNVPGSYSTYTTLSMTCSDGAMTKLVSADITVSGSLTGSVHLFGRANPTSGGTQTLTGNVVRAGSSFSLTLASVSLSGVSSVTGSATDAPASSAAMNLSVTSAAGHRPFFAAGFVSPPQDFSQRTRYYNFNSSGGTTSVQHMILADAVGAASATATTSDADYHAAVGVDIIPA